MEVVVVLMIVAVFGVWIYGLKQEISTLQKRLPPEKTAPTSAAIQPVALHSKSSGPAYSKSVERPAVQTWVLE